MMPFSREHAKCRPYRTLKERFRVLIWVDEVPEIGVDSSSTKVAIPVIPMLRGREDDFVLVGRHDGRSIVRITGRRTSGLVRVNEY